MLREICKPSCDSTPLLDFFFIPLESSFCVIKMPIIIGISVSETRMQWHSLTREFVLFVY